MVTVIGKNNCSSCEMTKNILNNKGVEYEYKMFEDLHNEEQAKLRKIARSFPILLIDGEVKTLQEVIK